MNDSRGADLKRRIFDVGTPEAFNALSLEIFCLQYEKNPVYRAYCDLLGIQPALVHDLTGIPFLPISFFRTHRVTCTTEASPLIFHSSGTTGSTPSTHHVFDPAHYEESIRRSFSLFYGDPRQYRILALTPSPAERPDSSLAYMSAFLIRESDCPSSGFYLGREAELCEGTAGTAGRRTLLLGLTYALLDLAEAMPGNIRADIVVETGGMKGRRRELTRDELHQQLAQAFGLSVIHSEYSMCELFSQAWSHGDGLFQAPPWMKILLRDPQDPLAPLQHRSRGGINIIDLANTDTCSFIATQDLGEVYPDGRFRISGRFDYSELRGCNLMLE